MKKAVFFDRDGVLVVPEFRNGRSFAPRIFKNFKIYDSASNLLQYLKSRGFLNIVITNQPDVEAGLITIQTLNRMHNFLKKELEIDDIEVCPHQSSSKCRRRKPNAGMLVDSGNKWGIDFSKSYFIGDRKSDIDAGNKVGIKSIFIDHNYNEKKPLNANFYSDNLSDAVNYILLNDK